MKKRTIYILLMALVGLSFTVACNNEKEFYDYIPAPDEKPGPDEPEEVKPPYTLNLAIKMSAEDLARLEKVDGKLKGIVPYTPSTTRADEDKNFVDFSFTKTADGITASFKMMEVVKSARQILIVTMTQINGTVTSRAADISESLSTLSYESTETPVAIEAPQIALPGKADDVIGGGSLDGWGDPTEVGGEAGSEINK